MVRRHQALPPTRRLFPNEPLFCALSLGHVIGHKLLSSRTLVRWLVVSPSTMKNPFSEKDLSRALRRHHAARLKHVRQGYWGRNISTDGPLAPRQQGLLLHTAALCSCPACGSPRKWFGERTVQELRQADVQKAGLALLFEDLNRCGEGPGEGFGG